MALMIGLALLGLALFLWWVADRWQARSGLPRAAIRYDDAGRRVLERPLVSHRYRLTGRPDYLLEQHGRLIPVEVKPTRRASRPYDSDLMQLAAYCLLVEEMGERPPYGILRYAEQSWEIPFDDALRASLLATLDAMSEADRARDVARSHNEAARCAGCSQRHHCSERLDR